MGNSITEVAARLLMEDESGAIQKKNLNNVYLANEDEKEVQEDGELLYSAPGADDAAGLSKGTKKATEPQADPKSRSSSTKVNLGEDDEIEIEFDEEDETKEVDEEDEKEKETVSEDDEFKIDEDDFPNLFDEEDETETKVDEENEDDETKSEEDEKEPLKENRRRRGMRLREEDETKKVDEEDEKEKETVSEDDDSFTIEIDEDDEKKDEVSEEDEDPKKVNEENEDDETKSEEDEDPKKVAEEDEKKDEVSEEDEFEVELDDLGEEENEDEKKAMNEAVAKLVGNNLTEEFRSQATTLFESYVNKRVHRVKVKLFEQFKDISKKRAARFETRLVEKLDNYLSYIVEEWVKKNKIALRRSLRSEIAEEFITKMKKVMNECNFDVPEGKRNLLAEVTQKAKSTQAALNEEIEKNTKLTAAMKKLLKKAIVNEEAGNLTDIQRSKLARLVEGFDFTGVDNYRTKIKTVITEHFSPKSNRPVKKVRDVLTEGNENGGNQSVEQIDKSMKAFADACSRIRPRNKQ